MSDHPDPNDNRFTYFDYSFEGVLGTRPNGDKIVMKGGKVLCIDSEGNETPVDCRVGSYRHEHRDSPDLSLWRKYGSKKYGCRKTEDS